MYVITTINVVLKPHLLVVRQAPLEQTVLFCKSVPMVQTVIN